MNRNIRAEKAQETLSIIENGFYEIDNEFVMVKEVIIKSLETSILVRSDEFEPIMNATNEKIKSLDYTTDIEVENTSVLKAATKMTRKGYKVGCLNFASAKNPGGGFLGGAQAQEESLALSSALYPTLMQHFELYEYNRKRSTFLYSDSMIYSPDVVAFRDDEMKLLGSPYTLNIITSPAVNIGAMKNNRPAELLLAEEVMMHRMDKFLALFVCQGIEHLLLGAWGCGVFQNNPKDVAKYFATYLLGDGKYSKCFKSVYFAVFDRSKTGENIEAFANVFAQKKTIK